MTTDNIDELTEQAEYFIDTNQIAKAQSLYERILVLDPQHADAWFMLGVINGDNGNINNGIECLEKSISIDPSAPDAYLNLGNLLHKRGDINSAINNLNQAIHLDQDYAEAYMLLGNVYAHNNSYIDAIRCFQKTIELWPESFEARMNLANAFRADGQNENAIKHLESLLQLQPNNTDALATIGDCLIRLHRATEAEMHFLKLTSIATDDPRGYNGLAETYISSGKLKEAEIACRTVLRLQSDNFQALANLGTVLQAKGDLESSRSYLEKATTLEPDNSAAHYKLSSVLLAIGEPDLAEIHCLRSIKLNPEFEEAQSALAAIYEHQGKFDSAWHIVSELIAKESSSPHVLATYAALSHRFGQIQNAINLMNNIICTGNNISLTTRTQIHHILGDLYEKSKDYNNAFLQHHKSNQLKENTFNPQYHADRINRIISTCDTHFMSTANSSHIKSNIPVFIVGMPRSGTSLVEQILASHPDTYGAGELPDMMQISANIGSHLHPRLRYPESLHAISSEILAELANNYLEKLRLINADALRITDKMPHNFMHLGMIQMLFPNAHIIHVIRNPLDTCVSIYFNEFSSDHAYAYNLVHLADYYKQYEVLMNHWEEVIELPILKVSYEDLVLDQETWSRRMIEFIGLQWDDNCLRFFENKRNVATPSYDQVRQPMYTNSIERWRRYDKYLNTLKSSFGIR